MCRRRLTDGSTPPLDDDASTARHGKGALEADPSPDPSRGSTQRNNPIAGMAGRPKSDGSMPPGDSDATVGQRPDLGSNGSRDPGERREFDWERRPVTDNDHASAARAARLRREVSVTATSNAELVRDKCAPTPTRSTHDGSGPEISSATKKGIERNTRRLITANLNDAAILGESPAPGRPRSSDTGSFLSSDASSFFPAPVVGPNDDFDPPSWFLEEILLY
jgi:hypothetical protein